MHFKHYLITDKPLKPNIKGDTDKMINTYTALTCSSNPTSAPAYYSKLVILSYIWFVNDTKMDGETDETLRFQVTRAHKYNRYSCEATAMELESYRSDTVQINPLCKTPHQYNQSKQSERERKRDEDENDFLLIIIKLINNLKCLFFYYP